MTLCETSERATFSPEKASKISLVDGDHCRVSLWCLEPGQEIRPHAHAGDHAWTVQQGEGWFLTGTETHPVCLGTFLFAPAGENHGMRAKTRLVFVSVSSG